MISIGVGAAPPAGPVPPSPHRSRRVRKVVAGDSYQRSQLGRHESPDARVLPMTNRSGMQVAAGEPQARRAGRVLSATRYRPPGDVILLIAAALFLAVTGALA